MSVTLMFGIFLIDFSTFSLGYQGRHMEKPKKKSKACKKTIGKSGKAFKNL